MQSESYVLRHEACPECRKLGNDKHGDNLAIYSDGHCYCFKCGHSTGRRTIAKPVAKPATTVVLPHDVSPQLPLKARQWLEQYQLSRLDLQQNHVMWSEQWSRIVFPYFDSTGLWGWQGRYIGENKTQTKWFNSGLLREYVHPIKVTQREAVLVEDIVSAIKVSKIKGAIPIFGSSVSNKQLIRLKTVVDRVWYWLDPDMRAKSVKMASMAKLFGLDTQVVFSDKDPKEHSVEEIQKILDM